MMIAHKYSSYTINGFNFHTQSYDEGRSIQNSSKLGTPIQQAVRALLVRAINWY